MPTRRSSFLPALLVFIAVFGVWVPVARAGSCKASGQRCQTNVSCCSRRCFKPTSQRGVAIFGTCCTPTTCQAQGKNCGSIPDGCGGSLDCGTCNAPQICGGGGTANVCCPLCGGTTCVDLDSDRDHCGTCGTTCPGTTTCVSGECVCPSGETLCGSLCVDLGTNPEYCGNCNTTCPGGSSCIDGVCQ